MNRNLPAVLLAVLLLGISLTSCTPKKQSVYKKGKVLMDTFVTITVVAGSEDKANKAIEDAFAVIERFGKLVDFFSDESEISGINRDAGIREVKVSPETLELVETALLVSEKSGGAFDVTLGPVIKLWDFYKKTRPGNDELKKNLALVSYRDVVVSRERSTVFLKKKGMSIDLGGIAKGYAADLAAKDLLRNGIQAGIVAAAGDIRTLGEKPDGRPWNIGIRNPRQTTEKDEIMATVELSGRAISTSGDYERYFIENDRRFHHILDPKTGYPSGLCRSVSVIADRGVLADAFSTAAFVLGPEKGLKLLEGSGLEGMIIDAGGEKHTTKGMQGVLRFASSH